MADINQGLVIEHARSTDVGVVRGQPQVNHWLAPRLGGRSRIRSILGATALALGLQLAFAGVGAAFPGDSGLYGAPFPIGQADPGNIFFGGGTSTFALSLWVVDVVVTAALLFVLSALAGGSMGLGAVVALLAMVVGFVPIAAQQMGLFGDQLTRLGVSDWGQLALWVWILVAVAAGWTLVRDSPR